MNYSFGLVTCDSPSGSYCDASSQVHITCQGVCGSDYGDGGNNAGGPGDNVTITVNYTWTPLFITRFIPGKFPGSVTYSVYSVFKNEQFPPAS